jgi:hypothetical protein
MPQEMQHHGQDHAVGGVAVNAAQNAARPPLFVGDGFNRGIGVMYAGFGKNIEIKAGTDQQPELPEADGAQMIKRVQTLAKGEVEEVFDAHEKPAYRELQ